MEVRWHHSQPSPPPPLILETCSRVLPTTGEQSWRLRMERRCTSSGPLTVIPFASDVCVRLAQYRALSRRNADQNRLHQLSVVVRVFPVVDLQYPKMAKIRVGSVRTCVWQCLPRAARRLRRTSSEFNPRSCSVRNNAVPHTKICFGEI